MKEDGYGSLRITKDKRVFLNGKEYPHCTRVSVILEAGSDPEVELRVAVSEINIEDYTNGIADLNLPSQSST